jgi:DMSO/TMAO reductase YedYZ heme-binding membrane subunit
MVFLYILNCVALFIGYCVLFYLVIAVVVLIVRLISGWKNKKRKAKPQEGKRRDK